MNRRTLITLIATAVILIGGITFAVKKLYSGTGNKPEAIEDTRFLESHRLLKAVPSDAAIVFCFKNFGDSRRLACSVQRIGFHKV